MFDSISLLIFMFFGLCFGLVMYLYALNESEWLFAPESKLLSWFKAKRLFDVNEVEPQAISSSQAHELVVELGESLELENVDSYRKIKDELHPKAREYFHRSMGLNIEQAPIKKAQLKLVK